MKTYPISIPVELYRGSNRTKKQTSLARISLARNVEEYINNKMKIETQETRVFKIHEIANAIHSSPDLVRDILHEYDSGSGGVTVSKKIIVDI